MRIQGQIESCPSRLSHRRAMPIFWLSRWVFRHVGSFSEEAQISFAQSIDPVKDISSLGSMPCARQSLLLGIGGGTAVGAIRFLSSKRELCSIAAYRRVADMMVRRCDRRQLGCCDVWLALSHVLVTNSVSIFGDLADQTQQGGLQTSKRQGKGKDASCDGRLSIKSEGERAPSRRQR